MALAGLHSSASAATNFWSGAAVSGVLNSWTNTGNWFGGFAPAASDTEWLTNNINTSVTNTGTGVTIQALQFGSNTLGSFTFSGSKFIANGSGANIAINATVTSISPVITFSNDILVTTPARPNTMNYSLNNSSTTATMLVNGNLYGDVVTAGISGELDFKNNGPIIVNGVISNTANANLGLLFITKTGGAGGTLTLNGVNTYSGGTELQSDSGYIVLGNKSSLGTGPIRIRGAGGSGNISASAPLTGVNAIPNTINYVSAITGTATTTTATNSLTLGSNVGTLSAGSIAPAVGDLVSGGTAQFLPTYALVTNVSGSTVTFNVNATATGTAVLTTAPYAASGGGTVNIGGTNNLEFSGTQNLTTLWCSNTPAIQTFNVTNTGLTTFSGVLQQQYAVASVIKTGVGTLVLSGNNTYTGGTTNSGGTLRINGQVSPNSGTGTGSVFINTGGTLSGNGRIAGNVSLNNINTAVLYPNSGGTLTLGGNLTFGGFSVTIKFDLSSSASGANDKVALENKTLTSNNPSTPIVINSAGTLDTNDYVLFDVGSSGTISGSFGATPTFVGTTPKYSSRYTIVTGARFVTLHYTPIPITVTAAANSKIYDGTTNAAGTPTITFGSLVSGDTGTFTESYTNKNVSTGNKTLVPSGTIKDSGNNDVTARYNITFAPIFTGTISPTNLTVTAGTANKTYDGTTSSTGTPTITSGAIQTGDAAPTWTQTFSTKNVGTRTLTPAGVVSDGNGGANYNVTYATVSSSISARAITVTAAAASKTYDGTTNSSGTPTITSGAIQTGDTAPTWTQSFDSKNASAVNGRTLTPAGVVTDGNSGNNYTYTYAAAQGTINRASTSVGASSTNNPSGYKASVAFIATLPADATGNVVFSSTNGAFSTNSLSGGTTTSLSITNLPRGINVITVAYLGDGNYVGSTNTLNQIVTNYSPVASVMTVTRRAGLALIIPLSDLATNWSDVDGDPVALTGVTMQSTNGVNLAALNWTTNGDGSIVTTNAYAYIGYTNSPNVPDQISYSIGDGQGGTNIGYLNIVIQNSVTGTNSITGQDFTSPYSNMITAYGIPGFSYILERATNLTSPVWVDVQTNQAATNGVINAADTFWDLGGVKPNPSAFYQLKWQP